MTKEIKVKTTSIVPKLMNGALAGMVGTCCVFPLDLAKTRLQNQKTVSKTGEQVTRLYRNVFHCMFVVGRTEGLMGLYKGLGINLLLVNPEKAIKLAVNDQTRQKFGSKPGGILPLHLECAAGAFAGFCQVVITTPMEFLKIQMQIAGGSGAAGCEKVSAMKLVRDLVAKDGITSVFRGYGATLIRDVPFSMMYFPFFAYLNSLGYRDGKTPHPVHSLVSGLSAGMVSAGAVTPLDVIKTRLQAAPTTGSTKSKYKGFGDAFVKILRQEGVPAFFKGAVPRMIVVAPLFGIAQMVYFFGVAENLIVRIKGENHIKIVDEQLAKKEP